MMLWLLLEEEEEEANYCGAGGVCVALSCLPACCSSRRSAHKAAARVQLNWRALCPVCGPNCPRLGAGPSDQRQDMEGLAIESARPIIGSR